MVEYHDGRGHVRVNLAEHLDDPGLGDPYRLRLAARKSSQVERFHARQRKDVVIDRVVVRKLHLGSHGDGHHAGNEILVALPDLHAPSARSRVRARSSETRRRAQFGDGGEDGLADRACGIRGRGTPGCDRNANLHTSVYRGALLGGGARSASSSEPGQAHRHQERAHPADVHSVHSTEGRLPLVLLVS